MKKIGCFASICAIYLILAGFAAHRLTPTVDEYAHLPAGIQYWTHGNFELYSKNPPLAKLWLALPLLAKADVSSPLVKSASLGWDPWLYGAEFENHNRKDYLEDFVIARWMNILVTLATGLLIFVWALDLKSTPQQAAAATALFLLSPTILAHGSLATLDLSCCFTILFFWFSLSRIRIRINIWKVLGAGGLLGVALATKFTAVFLIPWFFIFLLLEKMSWRKRAGYACAALVAAFFTIAAVYGFGDVFSVFPDLTSHAGRVFASLVPDGFRAPLPRVFITGFDAQMADTETGEFGSYLLGEWSKAGWWYYNFAAFTLKESPVLIVVIVLAAITAIKNGLDHKLWRRELWIPCLLIALPLLFLNRLQIGVRYLIPFYPFLILGLVPVLRVLSRRTLAIGLAAVSLIAGFAFPNYIAYFNPLALAIGKPEELLLDSNLDWGQDLYRLRGINVEAKGPLQLLYFGHVSPSTSGIDFQVLPATPVKGLIAVSANFLEGAEYVTPAPSPNVGAFQQVLRSQASWLRTLKPIRREGSIFI